MKILVVDGYNEGKRGRQAFNAFLRTLESAIKSSGSFKQDISMVHRNLINVGDYVLDWENEHLTDEAKIRASKFDTLDIICFGGDMQTCPWDPRCMQVVMLLHMAALCDKPVLGIGAGAFTGVYAASTNGARFHMLNEPYGLPFSKLLSFPRYSKGTKAFPSGFLNNETGDVYSFAEENKLWKPMCNVGMFRIATSGKPTPMAPGMSKPKHMAKDDHSLTEDQDPSAVYVDERETSVHIRNPFIQNRFLKGLASQNFIACELPNWHLNGDGALPTNKGVFVMAENKMGPMVLGKGHNCLFLACEINQGKSYDTMKLVMSNYIACIVEDIRSVGNPGMSLVLFLWGDSAGRGSAYDSTLSNPRDMAPTLTATAVASSLASGPTRVAMPVFDLFFQNKDESAPLSLARSKTGTIEGQKIKKQTRHPLMSRRKRLDKLFKATGNGDMSGQIQKVVAEDAARDPYGYGGGDAAVGAALTRDMTQGYESDPNSQSKVAGNLRKQRELYAAQVDREKRNAAADEGAWKNKDRAERHAAKKKNKQEARGGNVHPLDEYNDSMSLTSNEGSVGHAGELVKVGDRVVRMTHDPTNMLTDQFGFAEQLSHGSLSNRTQKSNAPHPAMVPEMAKPLTVGPNDWKKLQAKLQDDWDEKARLHNDKTRVMTWAKENEKLGGGGGGGGAGRAQSAGALGGANFSAVEKEYRSQRGKLTYEAPDSPNRMVRDSAEMRMFKQLSQGTIDRPGTAPLNRPAPPTASRPGTGTSNRQRQTKSGGGGVPTTARRPHSQGGIDTQRPLSGSSLTAKGIPRPKTSTGAVRLNSGARKPFNNAKKFADLQEKEAAGPYLGQYTETYMTPYEQEAAYIRKNKDKWSGGHFRLFFGEGKGLPLRKEGLIGGDGKFPDKVKDGSAEHIKGVDWLLVRRVDKAKQVGGAWAR